MTTAKNRTANQHWVPQFYLRQFATPQTQNADEPQFWFLDISAPAKDGKVTNVRNMCGWRYLYSPEGVNGERDWAVEELLGKFESLAASIWPSLIEGTANLADPALRLALSYFLSLMHLRSAWLYKLIDHSFELRDKLYGPPSTASLAALEPGMPDPTHSGRFFVQSLVRDAERFASTFAAKHWTVMYADKDVLLTSDRPLVFQRDDRGREVFIFPLSPRRVLFMTDQGDPSKSLYMPTGDSTAEAVNLSLGVHCIRFVFAGHPIPELLGVPNFSKIVADMRDKREVQRKRDSEESLRKYQQENR